MALPELDLTGRRAVVTAAGRGIGKGVALVLAEAGADLGLVALTPDHVTRTAQQVRALGRRAAVAVGDMTNPADVKRVAETLAAELGGVDILVNGVGDSIRRNVAPLPAGEGDAPGVPGMTPEEWRSILDINLTHAFLCSRAFGPSMLAQRRGVVLNIGAFASRRASGLLSAYSAGKAGLAQFTAALALEWAPYGVRVNCIAPGMFPDPEQGSPEQLHAAQERAAARVPLGRPGELREVGLLAAFLASDAAAYLTGQTLYLDGGWTL